MAEARSAVAEVRVRIIEEGLQNWKDFINAWRKYAVRNYYRTRNSVRNGVWPTSMSNLGAGITIVLAILLIESSYTNYLNRKLWQLGDVLLLSHAFPQWFQAIVIAFVVGFGFFLLLMVVRQYLLRLLLSYRGWMYEPLRVQSKKTLMWAILVRLVSGYQPSLYSCQRALPKLPVPPLADTISRLLESLKPLCTEEELETIKAKAMDFQAELGPKLQRILILRSWWASNYVSDWWENYVYLTNRSPLSINSNYYGMDQSYWTPTHSPISRAATVVHHCLMFKRFIDREELAPLVIRGTIPICMAQYDRIFSTIRVPGEEVDSLFHFDSNKSRCVIVLRKGLYYKMNVYDSKGQLLAPSALEEQLQWVMEDADDHADEVSDEAKSIAALTALERTEWARIRKKFFIEGVNSASMAAIERAILVVVMSDYAPHNFSEKAKYLLHGDGKCIWFDKSVNFIFFSNGQAGLNCEHSMADAPAMGHVWEYIMTKEVMEKLYTEDGQCMPMPKTFKQGWCRRPQRLVWEVNQELAYEVNHAVKFAQTNNADLDLDVRNHSEWGKGIIKKCKVSPDAFIQLALQLAYYKDAGKFAQTYEASMTRLYLCGRTETVRSCTVEATKFVKAMMLSNVSKEEKIELLKQAAESHQQLYRDAMNGKGIDRHLFALYVACKGLGHESDFLKQVLSRPWTLSTSQQPQQQQTNVPDANLRPFRDKLSPGGGFGPVSDDGYGVSYMLPSDFNIFFHVSSKRSAPQTDSKRFLDYIYESMEEMRQLCDE